MKLTLVAGIVVLASAFCLSAQAQTKELASWKENAAENFSVSQCLTIPGIPGTPQHCAPSTKVPYPCPSLKHPTKTCHHDVPGPCSPAIPGTPSSQQCATVNPGQIAIEVDGAVSTVSSGITAQQLTINQNISANLFGQHVLVPLACTASVGTEATVCLDLLTRKMSFEGNTGVSCGISGQNAAALSLPGVTAKVCMDLAASLNGSTVGGSMTARVESEVSFGSASIAGKTVSMGSKGWNPTLVKEKF